MRMTLPQIIMLNHAAWVNSKRADERSARKKDQEDGTASQEDDDPVVYMGKRFSELTSDDMVRYYGTVDDVRILHDTVKSIGEG